MARARGVKIVQCSEVSLSIVECPPPPPPRILHSLLLVISLACVRSLFGDLFILLSFRPPLHFLGAAKERKSNRGACAHGIRCASRFFRPHNFSAESFYFVLLVVFFIGFFVLVGRLQHSRQLLRHGLALGILILLLVSFFVQAR